ncbi:phage tail protein [Terrimonas sp. NA20]|uniref:Phage tail protein n=1 Tax=Terrimonas ginsenosidimutans TaxID=2908004 RepID=A0ABS9KRE0_9BACT|nr:phage tail protein [Terrimonas ginsenosidimutans]MCG2614898.1 phage tail protein [Terrimonas ginsenosidimutans]
MFAQLGSIQFENLKTPTDYQRSGEAIYAEHALIEGKPVLQATGLALDEINLSIRFDVSFCNPKNEIDAMRAAKDSREILPLLWGNGILQGNYVITTMSENITNADPQGNIFCAEVQIVLREYVVKDKVQQAQEETKKDAKAVGDKKPTAKKKANPPTCPQQITALVTKIENHGAAVNRVIMEGGGAFIPSNKMVMTSHLNFIIDIATEIKNRTNDPSSCAYNKIDLRNWAITVDGRAQTMKHGVLNDGDDLNNDNSNLQAAIKSLKAAARSFVNQSITRK